MIASESGLVLFAGGALAVLVAVGFFDEPEFDWRAVEAVVFTETALHVTLIGPVQELGVSAKDFEAWVGVVVLLDDVVELWCAVFEASWRV